MNHVKQTAIDFKHIDTAGKLKLQLKLKSYIQPFERLLAHGELYGLVKEDFADLPFKDPEKNELAIQTSASPEFLSSRLAYWEQVGSWRLEPTLQILLESERDFTENGLQNLKLHHSRKLRYGPHGIHEYRGKFFPQLVKALVNFAGLKPGQIVIDPMCGSGTTNSEAKSMGMETLGIDLNPLSVKISRVKSSVLDIDIAVIEKYVKKLALSIEKNGMVQEQITFPWNKKDQEYLERWFAPLALQEVAQIQFHISRVKDEIEREFLEINLSNILRTVSWQKDSDLRVRKDVTEYVPNTAANLFLLEVKRNIEKIKSYQSCFPEGSVFPKGVIKEGDARKVTTHLSNWAGNCDLLITSPPYAMALPYIDTDRLSLTVLGLLPRVHHRKREYQMIGNREVTDKERRELWGRYIERRGELPESVRTVIEKIHQVNEKAQVGFRRKNLSALLGKYFLDMADSMQDALAMMKPGSYGFYIVGNNSTTLNDERFEIETDRLLWEVGESAGWIPKQILNMELLPSRDIFRNNRGSAESILWFQAPDQPKLERVAIYGSASTSEEGETENGDWDFHNENTQAHLHGLHPYPARFIPQIPRKAILAWSNPGEVILDPFCGCGTTLLESSLLGREAIGIDNNAVACLVSQAKVTRYKPKDIKILKGFLEDLEKIIADTTDSVPLPEYKNIEYWFSDEAQLDLGRLKMTIDQLPNPPRLFALAVFSAIIVRVSNQDSDTRYARIEKEYNNGNAIKWFKSRLKGALNRLEEIHDALESKVSIYCIDGKDLSNIPDEKVRLIITSPPYINAYDYHKYHRHRIHWIGGDVALARDAEIGKHDTFTRPKATPDRYFEEMRKCFQEWKRVLVPGGKAFIVIGDGIVSKKPVPVGDMFVEIMEDLGMGLVDRWIRNLQATRKSFNQNARIDREHLLLFSKK